MYLIKKYPRQGGFIPGIVEQLNGSIPEGFVQIAPFVDTSAMQTHSGFVDLTIEGGMVTAITGNDAAYQAYLDSLPKPEPPAPDDLTMTQLAVAELAQTVEANNTANQLAIAELAETLIGGKANG